MWQPRAGFAWDVSGNGRSVVRASAGVYFARQNMLSQVGTVTTNGVQQQTIALGTFATGFATMPVWPGVVSPTPLPAGQFPAGSGIRVFDKNYVNPSVYSFNAAYEQQLVADVVGYVDVTWNEGTPPHPIPELQPQRAFMLRSWGRTRETTSRTAGRRGDRSSAKSW